MCLQGLGCSKIRGPFMGVPRKGLWHIGVSKGASNLPFQGLGLSAFGI